MAIVDLNGADAIIICILIALMTSIIRGMLRGYIRTCGGGCNGNCSGCGGACVNPKLRLSNEQLAELDELDRKFGVSG